MRLRLHPGEIWTVMRFGIVGAAATLTYLACSMVLLGAGVAPVKVNLIAFAVSLTLSYLGQYYFTYRAANAHARLSLRYALATLALIAICSILHRGLLQLAVDPRLASLAVTITYPLLSFILNHGWAYRRGAASHFMTPTGGE
jgi:putative flippase GtrA